MYKFYLNTKPECFLLNTIVALMVKSFKSAESTWSTLLRSDPAGSSYLLIGSMGCFKTRLYEGEVNIFLKDSRETTKVRKNIKQ